MEEKTTQNVASKGQSKNEVDLQYRNKKEIGKSGLLGFFIGLAIIVPGVSGSAVAIIFRLYEKLLYAFSNVFKKFKKSIKFLLPIGIGALVGIILGFFGVKSLLNIIPFAVVALFAGLMLGSFPAVKDQIKGEKRTPKNVILFIVGLIVPIVFSLLSVILNTSGASLTGLRIYHYILFLMLGYAVAITQLVPGLSATALLMMFGYFTPIVETVSLTYWQSNPQIFIVYACLIAGFLLGLITFSKILSYTLNRHRHSAFSVICGLSLGSAVTMFFNPDIYSVYTTWATNGVVWWDLCLGFILFAIGVGVAYFFVRYERVHTLARRDR